MYVVFQLELILIISTLKIYGEKKIELIITSYISVAAFLLQMLAGQILSNSLEESDTGIKMRE